MATPPIVPTTPEELAAAARARELLALADKYDATAARIGGAS